MTAEEATLALPTGEEEPVGAAEEAKVVSTAQQPSAAGTQPQPAKKRSRTGLIIGLVVAAIIVIIIVVVLLVVLIPLSTSTPSPGPSPPATCSANLYQSIPSSFGSITCVGNGIEKKQLINPTANPTCPLTQNFSNSQCSCSVTLYQSQVPVVCAALGSEVLTLTAAGSTSHPWCPTTQSFATQTCSQGNIQEILPSPLPTGAAFFVLPPGQPVTQLSTLGLAVGRCITTTVGPGSTPTTCPSNCQAYFGKMFLVTAIDTTLNRVQVATSLPSVTAGSLMAPALGSFALVACPTAFPILCFNFTTGGTTEFVYSLTAPLDTFTVGQAVTFFGTGNVLIDNLVANITVINASSNNFGFAVTQIPGQTGFNLGDCGGTHQPVGSFMVGIGG